MNPWDRYSSDSSGPWDQYAQQKQAPQDPAQLALADKKAMANDMPWWQAALIGSGKAGDAAWAGMKQLGIGLTGAAGNAIGSNALQDYATQQAGALDADQQGKNAEYQVLAKERPFATGFGEALPAMAVPGGAMMRGAKGLDLIASAGAQGAIPGLLEYGNADQRAERSLAGFAGGAAGGGLGLAAGRVIQPFRTAAQSETRQAALQAADSLGLKLTPGEIADSRPLKWMQAAIDEMPFASGMGSARRAGNADVLNAAALKSIGQVGNEITPEVLGQARTQIGGTFDDVFKAARVPLTDDAVAKLAQINGDAARYLPSDQAKVVANRIDEVLGKVEGDGAMPGLAYQKWRASAKSTNGDANLYLKQARDAVDQAASQALSSEKMDAFKRANQQWAALKTLNTGNVVNRETGNVMPKQLDNALASRYKDAYRDGRVGGDLAQVAKAGMLLREMPNSGTVPRAMYTGGVGGGVAGMLAGMVDPVTMAAAAASPVAAQFALNNPLTRRYASRGLFAVSPEMERLLVRGGALPGAAAGYGFLGSQ